MMRPEPPFEGAPAPRKRAPTIGGAPANVDAERATIGSFLKDPSLLALHGEGLKPEDFFHEPHRHIFEAISEVYGRGDVIDPVTVGEELRRLGALDAVGGPLVLGDMIDEIGTTIGLEHYIKIVREKAMARRMIEVATEIATKGYAADLELTEYLDSAEREVFSVLTGERGSPIRPIREVLAQTMELLQEQQARGGQMAGIPTGFDQLDRITMGLQRSDLLILAARPGMGKTSFALNVATHVAVNEGRGVAVFSLEMGAEQLAMRLLSAEGHVNLKELRGGKPSMEDFRRLTDAMARLSESKIYIDDTPAVSLAEVRSRSRRLSLRGELDLVVIDYLQLMSARSNSIPREQQISEISRGLKALAKELNIPVIALSQLNRSLESRQDKRPMLSDLRESGAIEQDADIIMFVYRDDYYHPDSDDQGIAEIIVGKQRNGPTDTARVAFIGHYTKFANLSPASEF